MTLHMLGQFVRVYIVSVIPHARPASPACAPARSPLLGPAGWPGASGLRGPGGHSRGESGWATKGENPIGFQYNSQTIAQVTGAQKILKGACGARPAEGLRPWGARNLEAQNLAAAAWGAIGACFYS